MATMNFFPMEDRNNEQQLFTSDFSKWIFGQQLLTDTPKTGGDRVVNRLRWREAAQH
jgi:hypothetical protein